MPRFSKEERAEVAQLIESCVKDIFTPALIEQLADKALSQVLRELPAVVEHLAVARVGEEARRILRSEIAARIDVTFAITPATP